MRTEHQRTLMRLLGGLGMVVSVVLCILTLVTMQQEERVLVRFFEEAERLAQDEQRKLEPTEHTLEFSIERLRELNKRFETAPLEDILLWVNHTFDRWAQVTSFGASGMVILDEMHRLGLLATSPTVVTIDTLYLFPETYAHVAAVEAQYSPPMRLKVMKPRGIDSKEQFEQQFGERLWEKRTKMYAHITKIEPTTRALDELQLEAWLTGRRRSQGGDRKWSLDDGHILDFRVVRVALGGERAALQVLERSDDGRVKVNPLAHWSHGAVWAHLKTHRVPYNPLHDRGYASVGDVGTTEPTPEGGGERAGRFTHSAIKECGMHSPFPNRWSPGMSVEQQRAFNQLAQQWDEQSTIRAAAAGVVQLHRSTFEEAVVRGYAGKHVLVELYAPWCPHCQDFELDFNRAAVELAAELPIVVVRMNWPSNHLESFESGAENPYQVFVFPMVYLAQAHHRMQPVLYRHDIALAEWVKECLAKA